MKKFKVKVLWYRRSKLRLNKKGIIFMSMMAVFFFILLLYSYKVLVIDKEESSSVRYSGETSLRIYDLSGEADLKEFLIKQSFKYSVYKAINKTAWEGGGCEFWNENCDPSKHYKNLFLVYLNESFKVYLKKFLGENYKDDVSYEISCRENFCELNVKELTLSSVKRNVGILIKRNFRYKLKFNFDFGIYKLLYLRLKGVKNCKEFRKLEKDIIKDSGKKIELKCYDFSKENYIKVKVICEDLLFVKPIIRFNVGEKLEKLKIKK